MFWIGVYLFLAYTAVAIALVLLRRLWEKSSPVRWVLFIGILLAPFLPYVVVATQTALLGNTLRPAVRQAMLDTGMMDSEIVTMRVLSLSPWRAKVYVTEYCGSRPETRKSAQVGEIITLRLTPAGWKLAEWDVVWSECGSAEGNTFPPYPEAREF